MRFSFVQEAFACNPLHALHPSHPPTLPRSRFVAFCTFPAVSHRSYQDSLPLPRMCIWRRLELNQLFLPGRMQAVPNSPPGRLPISLMTVGCQLSGHFIRTCQGRTCSSVLLPNRLLRCRAFLPFRGISPPAAASRRRTGSERLSDSTS